MGRLTRALVATLAALLLVAGGVRVAVGFTGFGTMTADASYGVEMRFRVELIGGAPERVELLLRFAGDEATFVAPVDPGSDGAEYVWDAADRHVTPNTRITYSWRAIDGDRVTLSQEATLLYDDDRDGFDWHSRQFGDATVHWYGDTELLALHLGELADDGTAHAETLLGHEMTAPVDIFVYGSTDAFFGALGPGAREWTGAATYPALRTIFMARGSGDEAYLERTLVHEVTHVVFNDATENPFHEPAKWLNEGLASWAETDDATQERSEVEFEASGGGLFAFAAIAEQFPIGERGARLAYAQGATMVDMIVAAHGPEAIARIAAAYRDGASDAAALEAGTGSGAEALYADFFDEFGVDAPQPVEAAPIPPSNVRKPGGAGGSIDEPGATAPADGVPGDASGRSDVPWAVVGVVGVALAVLVIGALAASRRGRRGPAT